MFELMNLYPDEANEISNEDLEASAEFFDRLYKKPKEDLEKEHANEWFGEIALNDDLYCESMDSIETVDGCMVEPDGTCPHGYRSPMIVLGII